MSTDTTPMQNGPLLRGHPRATAVLALGILALIGLYVTMPTWRDGALTGLCLALLGGLFTLRPRDVQVLVGLTAGLMGLSVLALWRLEPGGFDLARDGLSALMVGAMVPAVGHAVTGFARRRERLEAHRQALTQALADMSVAATCDPLTGLYNERHMRECMGQEARRCQRAGTPLSVALIDIEGLRHFNTRHGFELGDQALCSWASAARAVFRQTDVVGRWSAELFIVLFPDSSTEQAALGIQRLRAELAHHRVGGIPCPGFADGLVDWPADQPIDTVIDRAREALQARRASAPSH